MMNIKFRRQNVLYFPRSILLTVLGIVLIVSLIACGRRGDPILVSPVADTIIENGADEAAESAADQDVSVAEDDTVAHEVQTVSRPDAPKRLIAVYTGSTVVLTWDEIVGQGVSLYRVYRMEDETYKIVGESITPAFTDKSIEADRVYNYKISAIGLSESPKSEEIRVVTEKR